MELKAEHRGHLLFGPDFYCKILQKKMQIICKLNMFTRKSASVPAVHESKACMFQEDFKTNRGEVSVK